MAIGEVPVGPLQEAFAASGLTVSEIANRIGCNEAAVRRNLRPNSVSYCYRNGKKLGPYKRKLVTYEVAINLARAMNVDPWELGL